MNNICIFIDSGSFTDKEGVDVMLLIFNKFLLWNQAQIIIQSRLCLYILKMTGGHFNQLIVGW